MEWNLRHIPAGREGTDATLKAIGELVLESQQHPTVRLAAISILDQSNTPASDSHRAMQTLFEWTRRNIQYLNDPADVELVQSPENTLKLGVGDCDDQATLMAAFAANLGIPARLVTIGQTPDLMEHIFPEALLDGEWTPMDTTIAQPFGYAPQLPYRKIYDLRGTPMVNLGAAARVLPVTVEAFQNSLYKAVYNQIAYDWQRGNINYSDLKAYLSMFRSGNQPAELRGTPAQVPTHQAISDFLKTVDRAGIGTEKPGLKGLAGLFDGILNTIKGVVGVIPGVGSILSGGISVIQGITGGGGGAQGGQLSLMDIERAINSAGPVDINAVVKWAQAQGGAIGWLPITSGNSFLRPPTLPMYLMTIANLHPGNLSMAPDSYVPFTGAPQTADGGQMAVNEITKQFGVTGGGFLSLDAFYKINPANAATATHTQAGGGLFDMSGGLFSNPLVLIGGSVLVYLLLRPGRGRG